MADFVAVLKKTIGGLSSNTPEARERVYQKARDTVAAKLAAMQPPPSSIVVERQKKALEAAIAAVESGFARDEEPEDEFAAIFSGDDPKSDKPAEMAEPVAEDVPEPEPVAGDASEPEPVAEEAPEHEPAADKPKPEEPAEAEPALATATGATKSDEADAGEGSGDELKPIEPVAKPAPVLAGSIGSEKSEAGKPHPAQRNRRRISGGLIAALAAILVVAAAGYGIWLNRDAFMSMFAATDQVAVAPADDEAVTSVSGEEAAVEETAPAEQDVAASEEDVEAAAEDPAPADSAEAAAAEEDQGKFTQRLTPEGDEVDPGPAGGEPTIGEGTSVASATRSEEQGAEPSTDSETSAAPEGDEMALPVGQRAIFYEERTTASDSTAEAGATVWSVVQESPGGDLPPEPAIRAEVTVPSKDLQLRMTIRRNSDTSLPASHIIEMIFLTSEGFEGGGIDNVLRVAFKPTEAAPGNQLIGIPAKIADGYFLIALSDVPEERDFNLQLMRQQSWIDIPIVYSSGRRALVTMERGVPGDRTFIDVLATWEQLASEESSAEAANGN